MANAVISHSSGKLSECCSVSLDEESCTERGTEDQTFEFLKNSTPTKSRKASQNTADLVLKFNCFVFNESDKQWQTQKVRQA